MRKEKIKVYIYTRLFTTRQMDGHSINLRVGE